MSTTNSFSLVFKWEKLTDKKVAGMRAAQPAKMAASALGTASRGIFEKTTCVPTSPNSSGCATQVQAAETWCSTCVANVSLGPDERKEGRPRPQAWATATPSTMAERTPAPANLKETMKYI